MVPDVSGVIAIDSPTLNSSVQNFSALNSTELVEFTSGNLRFLWSHTHGYRTTTWVAPDVPDVVAIDSPTPNPPVL